MARMDELSLLSDGKKQFMKRLLVLLFLITSFAFGQKKNPRLFEFKASTCDRYEDTGRLRTRIISKTFKKDTLTIHIAATATCGDGFTPKVMISPDSVNLDFEQAQEYECFCCFEFTCRLLKVKNRNLKIRFRGKEIEESHEKYWTYPVKFDVVNGDTVNYEDRYGMRQGKFISESDQLMKSIYYVYLDNVPAKKVLLYPNGKIRSISSREKMKRSFSNEREVILFSDYNYYVEYYPTGKKKSECFSLDSMDSYYSEHGHCKEWDEDQILIYEGPHKKN